MPKMDVNRKSEHFGLWIKVQRMFLMCLRSVPALSCFSA